MITPTEVELLAGLKDDPAYLLLLSKIKVLLEDMEDQLHSSKDGDTRETFAMWKALRTVYIELKETPEHFSQIVAELKPEENYSREVKPKVTKELKEYFLKLQGIHGIEQDTLAAMQQERLVNPQPVNFI